MIYLLLWLISLAGISFWGGVVSYGFFMFMTLVPVVSILYLLAVFLAFKVYQQVEGRDLIVNHAHPFLFILQNEFFFTFSGVKVNLFSDFSRISGQDDGAEYELLPKSGIRNDATLICRYRGEYDVGVKDIVITDYLRLFRLRYKNKGTVRVTVKPDLIRMDELHSVDIQLLNSIHAPANPQEPDVLVRKYEPGDDTRFIEWKASARAQELLVRKRTGEEQQGVGILMATERKSDKPSEYLPLENKILELVLALAWHFTAKNTPVSVDYLGTRFRSTVVDRPENFNEFYEEMSSVTFSDRYTEKEMFEGAGSAGTLYLKKAVFMVLSELSEEALTLASMLYRHHISAVIYLISDDPESVVTGQDLPGTSIVRIPKEAVLREVL
ncbi:MAG: DUF58 domain-containing protein [Lachnospiraceae bacterium]|nr:DUF58 domain-containing protein [Lachnospiraceae bacterium]